MNWNVFYTRRNRNIVAALIGIIFGIAIYWVHYLNVAHSSFENYYKFRGCAELVERTDSYATCKLSSGKVIKIVKYDNRWFLDGDLPGMGF